MKKSLALTVLALAFVVPAFAQNHGEIGVFADYFRLRDAGNLNLVGVGGRASFNVHENVQLEAEMAYDFERNFTTTFVNPSLIAGNTVFVRSGLRVLHGMFGPKLQTGGGPVRAFLTVKGGFINFSSSVQSPGAGFTTAVSNLTFDNTKGVLYPGGGLEAYLGPIGLRLDVGDEIYFADGARNNLKVTFGPHIRF
jgi:hypothetical protein